MWFPDDIDAADIDWVKPLVAYPKPTTETEQQLASTRAVSKKQRQMLAGFRMRRQALGRNKMSRCSNSVLS
jgi:hypothetical protein